MNYSTSSCFQRAASYSRVSPSAAGTTAGAAGTAGTPGSVFSDPAAVHQHHSKAAAATLQQFNRPLRMNNNSSNNSNSTMKHRSGSSSSSSVSPSAAAAGINNTNKCFTADPAAHSIGGAAVAGFNRLLASPTGAVPAEEFNSRFTPAEGGLYPSSSDSHHRLPTTATYGATSTTESLSTSSFSSESVYGAFRGHHTATAASAGPLRGSSVVCGAGPAESLKHVNSSRNTHQYSDDQAVSSSKCYSASMSNMNMRMNMNSRDHHHYHHSGVVSSSSSNSSRNLSRSKKEGKEFWGRLVCRLDDLKYFGLKILKNNKRETCLWILLMLLIAGGYKFLSDGSFSAVLTLASAFQCFSLSLIIVKVFKQQTVSGISFKTLYAIVISLSFRLVSTGFYNGYLPVDRSGDWVYQLADALTVLLILFLICYSKLYLQSSLQQQYDNDNCYVVIPSIVALVLALLIHPTLNQKLLADVTWTFALYLETFSMVPQLFMMGKLGGEIESFNSHFVASMAASKFFVFLFWFFSYKELSPRVGGVNVAGWAVLICYILQLVLYADFFYYYIRSIRIGRTMIINI